MEWKHEYRSATAFAEEFWKSVFTTDDRREMYFFGIVPGRYVLLNETAFDHIPYKDQYNEKSIFVRILSPKELQVLLAEYNWDEKGFNVITDLKNKDKDTCYVFMIKLKV